MKDIKLEDINLEWLGHAAVRITAENRTIYIDPYQIDAIQKADLILITHGHYDHCSIADIKKIVKNGTIVIATSDCISQLRKVENISIKIVSPNKDVKIANMPWLSISTVPAYNIAKMFHSKDNEWVGYVLDIKGHKIYHAGDTDFIPEMREIKDIDVAFLPVGGTYTMNAEEAAEAASVMMPKIAVPIHYGAIVGSEKDAQKFKELCKCKVEILEKVN
ncbi:MAG: MBL fold metallo-hydrolase [Candidatus Woesearchaeota archaeon]